MLLIGIDRVLFHETLIVKPIPVLLDVLPVVLNVCFVQFVLFVLIPLKYHTPFGSCVELCIDPSRSTSTSKENPMFLWIFSAFL